MRDAKPHVDQIVLVDTGSTDETPAIALRYGAQVVHYRWDHSLGRARNAYLRQAKGQWVVVLDADETISPQDWRRLKAELVSTRVDGFWLPVRNYTRDHDLLWDWFPNDGAYPREERYSRCTGWAETRPLRVFRRLPGLRYVEGFSVHTTVTSSLVARGARIEHAPWVIHHFQFRQPAGADFVAAKQRARVAGELRHARYYRHDAVARLNLAKTYFNQGDDRRALHFARRAARIDPTLARAEFVQGLVQIERGKWAEARAALDRARALEPENPDYLTALGIAAEAAGELVAAVAYLEHALRLRPKHAMAHNSLGVVYARLGRRRLAARAFTRALQIRPSNREARLNLSKLAHG